MSRLPSESRLHKLTLSRVHYNTITCNEDWCACKREWDNTHEILRGVEFTAQELINAIDRHREEYGELPDE